MPNRDTRDTHPDPHNKVNPQRDAHGWTPEERRMIDEWKHKPRKLKDMPAHVKRVFRLKAKDDKLKAKAQDAKNPVKGAKLDLRRMFGK